MSRLAAFVGRRGKPVVIQEYTRGAPNDPNWEDDRRVPASPRTVKAVREMRELPRLHRSVEGESSEWDAVFHIVDGGEPVMPTGTNTDSEWRPQVTDEDGNRYTVEEVGREELGLRRLFCTKTR